MKGVCKLWNETGVRLYVYTQWKYSKKEIYIFLNIWNYGWIKRCMWSKLIEHMETNCKTAKTNDVWFWMGSRKGRSMIDCGYMIYGAATKSNLEKLDKMQHRVLVEAMQTTPINALLVESNEIPLDLLELN